MSPKTAKANVTRNPHTCSDRSGQRGISWDTTPLGLESDSELGRRLGVSSGAVRKARLKRGIPLTHRDMVLHTAKMAGVGEISDNEIAQTFGKSRRTISRYRRHLGFHGPLTVDWDKEPLGQVPDQTLATKWGVHPSVVGVARRQRGIARGDLDWVTTEGASANYPEACIDLWLHENGIPHEYQVRVGTYLADWVVDGTIVVEYAGFENHRKFGAQYAARLAQKTLYYQSIGMSVLILRPTDMSFVTPTGTPGFRPRGRSCGACGTSFSATLRHKAKGLCRGCYPHRRAGT